MTRKRAQELPHSEQPDAVTFVPKGAYITNISSSNAFAKNTWICAVPDQSLWPKDDTAPCTLTARVAERARSYARLELLTYADGMRASYHLTARSYANTPNANTPNDTGFPSHAITKRLLFAEHSSNNTATVPQPGLNDIRGNELYAAIDLESNDARLGAQISALLRVADTTTEYATLQTFVGAIPQHAAFVLLDAWTAPGYHVQIHISNEVKSVAPDIQKQISNYIQSFPSASYIDIINKAPKDIDALLGAKQTDALVVALTKRNDAYFVEDQSIRIGLNPWPLFDTSADADLLALNAATRALVMSGDFVSAVWMLEDALRKDTSNARFAVIAPALAGLYHALERDDWSLELALDASERLNKASSADKRSLINAQAAIAAQTSRTEEFKSAFASILDRKPAPDAENAFTFRDLALAAMNDAQYAASANAMYQRLHDANRLTPYDEQLRCFALSQSDETACDAGEASAKSPFDTIFYTAIESLRTGANDDTILKSLTALDDVGAPFIAQLLWMQLARHASSAETAEALMLNASAYAHRAQDHRAEIAIAELVQQSRSHRAANDRDNALAPAIRRWQSLDSRARLAALCYDTATQAARSQDERTKLLTYAYQLYLSIGDAANARACQNAMK